MNRRLSSGEGREDPTAAAAARKQRKCCPPPPPSLPALSLPVFTLFLSHCFPAFRCPLKWPCHWPTPGIGRKLEVRPGKHLLAMLLLIALLPATCQGTHHRHEHGKCTVDGTICSTSKAQICRNNTCVSVCSLRGMKECRCDSEEDNYCFLCCGSGQDRCLPAHDHGILRDNGERWERESCSRCRMNGAEMEGLACDDTDPQRLCLQGKCSKSVCADKQQGQYCDRKMEKICVDDMCENPCAKISSHLMVCECPSIDPDTGFASEDRCQLCCYDFNQKPASRRCRNAFRNYDLRSTQERPIWRIGLECAGGKRCNRYGICSNDAEPSGNGNHRMPLIFLAILLFVLVAAALVTTSETF